MTGEVMRRVVQSWRRRESRGWSAPRRERKLASAIAVVTTVAMTVGVEIPDDSNNARVKAAPAICSMPSQNRAGDATGVVGE